MKTRRAVGMVVSGLVMAGILFTLGGCFGIPKDTLKEVAVGKVTLQATGAGLVTADAQKTTFKIKCAVCGYEAEPITIDTPVAGKPYILDWVCPNCGHKQKIEIQATAP
jgi:hypothetical protein